MTIEPQFTTTPLEARAVCISALNHQKKPPFKLKEQDKSFVSQYMKALKAGKKAQVYRLSRPFYEYFLSDELIERAYVTLTTAPKEPNPDFEIVMDSLKKYQRENVSPLKNLGLAIEIACLTITNNDKNAIFYQRLDEKTGQNRPTTFPLSETVIWNFMSAFGDYSQNVSSALQFVNNKVIGTPFNYITHQYFAKKERYLKEVKAKEKEKALLAAEAKAKLEAKQQKKQSIVQAREDYQAIIESAKDKEEQSAVQFSMSGPQFKTLLKFSQDKSIDFDRKLEQIYKEKLVGHKAKVLSARLSSRMKKMMVNMGTWKDDYWTEFQVVLQKNGLWDGMEWLEKWRSHKTGKQILQKSGKDYLVEGPQENKVGDMILKAENMRQKQLGLKMMGLSNSSEGFGDQNYESKASAEQKKVLNALYQEANIADLLELSLDNTDWESIPDSIIDTIYKTFMKYAGTDMIEIKDQFMFSIPQSESQLAKNIMAKVELGFNKVVSEIEYHRKMSFDQAIQRLLEAKDAQEKRNRVNSQEFKNSAAGSYSKYGS